MAEIFIQELKDMLLTEDDVIRIIDQGSPDKNLINMDILPSPEQLNGKIILKVTGLWCNYCLMIFTIYMIFKNRTLAIDI